MAKQAAKRPGALWATVEDERAQRRLSMPVAIALAAVFTALALLAIAQLDVKQVSNNPVVVKLMRIVDVPPTPEPPALPPPEPPQQKQPEPKPTPAAPTPQPEPPAPQPAAVDKPTESAPALGTLGITGPAPAPSAEPAPATPAASSAPSDVAVVCPGSGRPPPVAAMMRELQIESLEGEIRIELTIAPDGAVSDVKILKSNTTPPRVADAYLVRRAKRYKCQGTGFVTKPQQEFSFSVQ